MNTSGEAADQVVRMTLNGVEVAAKLSGAAAKQVAVMLYAILKDQKRTKGKMRLSSMLRSGKELRVFAVQDKDLQKFCEAAKQYGILYCVLKDKNPLDGMTEIMAKAEDAAKINHIFERFKLATVDMASVKTEITKTKTKGAEDIPEPDVIGKENVMHGSILPVLNKKLIANSMNILFDLLQKSKNKALIQEVSSFLMLAVYRVFRVVYSANPKNQNGMFTVPKQVASHYAAAAMEISEANAAAVASGDTLEGQEPLKEIDSLAITTESLNHTYPMFASSLLNLIQNSESKITKEK